MQGLETVSGKQGLLVRAKSKRVFSKNYDFDKLKNISKILQGDSSVVVKLYPSVLLCFKFAPITSLDVERSFSQLKNVLSDWRSTMNPENLKNHLVVMCNNSQ